MANTKQVEIKVSEKFSSASEDCEEDIIEYIPGTLSQIVCNVDEID